MRRISVLIIVILLLAVGVLGYFGYQRYYYNKKIKNKRTAVFTTNGQVYFGFLSDMDKNYVRLYDIYYLKTSELQSNPDKKILLVKMGNELHKPENTMYINRDQILFWQTIQEDSKINDAISKFNQNNTSAVPSTPNP